MSFFDTLFRKLGFSMEEGEERGEEIDDGEEQEEDEGEDEGQGSRFSFRFANPFRGAASDQEEEPEEEPEPSRTRRGNVIHDSRMDARAAQEAQFAHRTRIVNVRQIEECRSIIQYLLGGESILLNLENIDPKDCGRVVDLLSGAAFALQGRMLKVAHLSYLLAPESVEVVEEDLYAAAQHRYR